MLHRRLFEDAMGAFKTQPTACRVEHHSAIASLPFEVRDRHQPAEGGRRVERFLYSWRKRDRRPRAGIGLIHGLGEHAGRYEKLAGWFVEKGFDVWSFDQQGHGQTEGDRGVITRYDHLLEEVGYLLELIQQELTGLPVFLIGHSMGGNLVMNYVLRCKLLPEAVIASSPMFRTPKEPKGMMNTLARWAARLAPNLCISTEIDSRWLTNDKTEQAAVDQDPFYHRRVSLRLGAALIDSGRWALEHAYELKVPTLITHGALDRLTMHEGSAEFANRAGKLCRYEFLPDHLHETFRDIDGESVLDMWFEFLNGHCKA